MGRNVVFRVDASLQIGSGHVMRCLTLAEALREQGAACHFICRNHPGSLEGHIRGKGFPVHMLSSGEAGSKLEPLGEAGRPLHAAWLDVEWEVDASETRDVLVALDPDWLVVDHYALDHAWESEIRSYVHKVMVIDDLADRVHDCDILLDQNLGRMAGDYSGLVPESCLVLGGTRYTLLRPEFLALREYSLARRAPPSLRHVLVTMGGVDRDNVTGTVLNALRHSSLAGDCRITVVMGAHAPWKTEVMAQAKDLPWPCEVRVDIADMAQLMADCDLAIGAAGSTSWERCSLGLPAILVVLADNQKPVANALASAGAALAIGTPDGVEKLLPEYVSAFNVTKLEQATELAARICDGRGSGRVVGQMRAHGCIARTMRDSDVEMVLEWRNRPEVRRFMYTRHQISHEEHRAWYSRTAVDPLRHLLIVEEADGPIGFVQFGERAEEKGAADWGFYLAPEAPAGSGWRLGTAALSYAFKQIGLNAVRGEALASNERSIALHRRLGFREEGDSVSESDTSHDGIRRFGISANDWWGMQ